jgi:hypothetical protein
MTVHKVCLAEPEEFKTSVEICSKHTGLERAPYEMEGKLDMLRAALFGAIPSVRAWVAIVEDDVVGYATATEDYSTWIAASFLHMDCLIVRPGQGHGGIGAVLLSAVV